MMFDLFWQSHWRAWKAYEYPGFHAKLREMRHEDRLGRLEWESRQAEKLRDLLRAAFRTVDYYKELFARAAFRPETADLHRELARLPVLTKDTIRQNAEKLVSKASDRKRFRANSTGGSTGVPLNFFQDDFYATVSSALAAHIPEWWGIRPYDKTASVWGADQDLSNMSWRERCYLRRSRTRILNAFRMSEVELSRYARMLDQWRPAYMKGYSSALEALARHVVSSGRRPPRFNAIGSSAEMLWPEQRRLIEDTFRTPVFDFYGSREVSNLAAECPEERRLHQVSTWRYIEIVGQDGEPVPDGVAGYVAITDASNFAMPFIRYVNGDVARVDRTPCPCGRPSPVLEELLGRSTDLIRTAGGDLVHGEFFTHLFYGRHDILQFQVQQVSLDRLIVRYIPTNASQPPSLSEAVEQIRDRMGQSVHIEIRACREIPLLPSGKRRFTVSDVSGVEKTSSQSVS